MEKYDLIVIGGGTGGSITGRIAAELGFKVCIIDRKVKTEIGSKACGEAVGKHHFDYLGIQSPKGDELASVVNGIDVFSPNLKTVFRIKEKGLTGFMINRLEFGQRLLNEALDAGVELLDQMVVRDPIFKNDFIVGVKVKDYARNKSTEVNGNIVIDASGVAAVLRRKMPIDWGIERMVAPYDMETCYQEIREISSQIQNPGFLKIHFSRTIAPGGYYWIFPKENNRVNVGLGVQMKNSFPNPKDQLYKHVLSTPLFTNSKKIKAGMGLVPTRRALNLVGNGILFVGDAACQTNPAHGGGIGPSMLAGKLAVQTACQAMETGDYSQRNLWSYNVDYTKHYGIKYAGLDVFRILLQKCRDKDLNYGMANGFIKGEYIFSRATLYDDVVSKITNTSRHRPFFKTLIQTSEAMKRIKKMYEVFPQPEKYPTWIREVDEIIAEMKGLVLVNGDSEIDLTNPEKEYRKIPLRKLSL